MTSWFLLLKRTHMDHVTLYQLLLYQLCLMKKKSQRKQNNILYGKLPSRFHSHFRIKALVKSMNNFKMYIWRNGWTTRDTPYLVSCNRTCNRRTRVNKGEKPPPITRSTVNRLFFFFFLFFELSHLIDRIKKWLKYCNTEELC